MVWLALVFFCRNNKPMDVPIFHVVSGLREVPTIVGCHPLIADQQRCQEVGRGKFDDNMSDLSYLKTLR